MSVFIYTGLDAGGQSVKGSLEAKTEKSALDQLAADGIIPVEIKAGAEGDAAAAKAGFSLGGERVPFAVRTIFVRELATFLRADVPLLEAIGVLQRQETHAAFKRILADLHERVQKGDSFSKALTEHPKVFPALLISMAKVGETGGMLAEVLEQMANWMEQEEEIRGEIRGALAYPLMILALGIVTVIVLMTFVLPRISAIFAGMEANLPLPTRILMGSSAFMGRWWWAIPLALIGVAAGLAQLWKTPKGRRFFDKLSLTAPILGTLTVRASVSRFSRASAALLSAGVPLLEALKVVRGLLSNTLMSAMVDHAIEEVIKGQSLATALRGNPYFPAAALHLVGVGERTGRLSEMFGRLADTFERQMRQQIKVLLNLLSPLMIVALAVLVAFIAISILLPIFQMNKLMR